MVTWLCQTLTARAPQPWLITSGFRSCRSSTSTRPSPRSLAYLLLAYGSVGCFSFTQQLVNAPRSLLHLSRAPDGPRCVRAMAGALYSEQNWINRLEQRFLLGDSARPTEGYLMVKFKPVWSGNRCVRFYPRPAHPNTERKRGRQILRKVPLPRIRKTGAKRETQPPKSFQGSFTSDPGHSAENLAIVIVIVDDRGLKSMRHRDRLQRTAVPWNGLDLSLKPDPAGPVNRQDKNFLPSIGFA